MKRLMIKLNRHRTTETYFVAYPKTGSTWTRFLLGRYVQLFGGLQAAPLFDETDIYGRCERYCDNLAIQFTHRPLSWKHQTAEHLGFSNVVKPFIRKKVVLVARHPLDTLVSHWHHESFQSIANGRKPYRGDIKEFLADPVLGLEKCGRFYQIWEDGRSNVKDFFLLRYEDIKENPAGTLKKLLEFLDIQTDDAMLASAIQYASFSNMQIMETSKDAPVYQSSGFKVFSSGDLNDPNARHVRRGEVNGYRQYLGEQDIVKFEQMVCEMFPAGMNYGNQ